MKKLFLFLACFIINIENVRADEPLSAEEQSVLIYEKCAAQASKTTAAQPILGNIEDVKRERDIKNCIKKEILDEINIYNDDLKKLDAKYHQCLKSVIVSKINELAAKEDADKMIQSLNKIQDGILSFYWNLYNREDNGVIGRGINDAAMGRYYETLLEDVIHFQRQ